MAHGGILRQETVSAYGYAAATMAPDAPVQARAVATRAAITRATVASLVDVGLARTSVSEVCRRAGVARGTLLYHFPTRGDLIAGALEDVVAARAAALEEALAGAPRTEEAVVAALWATTDRRRFAMWAELVVAARTDPELRDAIAAASAGYERLGGELLPGGGRTRTMVAYALINGLMLDRMLGLNEQAVDDAAAALPAILRVIPAGG